MICPKCGNSKTIVIDSRPVEENVFRKRKCLECDNNFYTEEMTIEDDDIRLNYQKKLYAINHKK